MKLFWKRNRNASDHPPGTKINVNLEHMSVTCPKCKTVHTGADVWKHTEYGVQKKKEFLANLGG